MTMVVSIVPARGGSKAIPRKNVMDFCGKPLIAWSIEQALGARLVDEVFVSTDNEEIAEVSKQFGARIIDRPPALATDTASSEDALLHAIQHIEQTSAEPVDKVVFLQCTSPLRSSKDIDQAIESFVSQEADSLFSAAILDDFCAWEENDGSLESLTFDYKNRGRRQDRKPYYLENGSIYVFKPEILRRCNNRLGGRIAFFPMPFWKSYEIDTLEDVKVCEFFMKRVLERGCND